MTTVAAEVIYRPNGDAVLITSAGNPHFLAWYPGADGAGDLYRDEDHHPIYRHLSERLAHIVAHEMFGTTWAARDEQATVPVTAADVLYDEFAKAFAGEQAHGAGWGVAS